MDPRDSTPVVTPKTGTADSSAEYDVSSPFFLHHSHGISSQVCSWLHSLEPDLNPPRLLHLIFSGPVAIVWSFLESSTWSLQISQIASSIQLPPVRYGLIYKIAFLKRMHPAFLRSDVPSPTTHKEHILLLLITLHDFERLLG